MHSPDGVHSCVLRANDTQEALIWFNSVHLAIGKCTQKALLDANRTLSPLIGELKHIGWLSRKLLNDQVIFIETTHRVSLNGTILQPYRSDSESSDEFSDKWQSVFLAITDRDLRIYESAPWSAEAWTRPLEICPLVATRLAGSCSTYNSNVVSEPSHVDLVKFGGYKTPGFQAQSTSFCIRCGTSKGVISYWFRTETYRDMAAFARAVVQGCHIAVTQQREFSFRCTYQVTLHFQFSIKDNK